MITITVQRAGKTMVIKLPSLAENVTPRQRTRTNGKLAKRKPRFYDHY